ncbi:MAG: 2-succinyl-6-hydroxy-2,4-cyclohexadiene-1-carboxylate synthase [Myxococcales bacterium]|nr:2-succinyl-6-hydroxy-2,4-cyclohexadiene-1-carboxylate synthase [Myxococcales bacterium]
MSRMHRFVERTPGRRLYAESRGTGAPLLLLHGFTGSVRAMAPVIQSFERNFEVIAWDLIGHGRSAAPTDPDAYSFAACIADAHAVLDAFGYESAHWIGYGLGARIALAAATSAPDRIASMVLIAPSAGIAEPEERETRRRRDAELAESIAQKGVTHFVDRWMALPPFATQQRLGKSALREARRDRLSHTPHGLAHALRGLGVASQPPLFEQLGDLRTPSLLILGELDAACQAPVRDLAKRLPKATLCEIADAGHAAHLEQPEVFSHVVREFLRTAPRPRARETAPLETEPREGESRVEDSTKAS